MPGPSQGSDDEDYSDDIEDTVNDKQKVNDQLMKQQKQQQKNQVISPKPVHQTGSDEEYSDVIDDEAPLQKNIGVTSQEELDEYADDKFER